MNRRLKKLMDILVNEDYSLVVETRSGIVMPFDRRGVADLHWLYKEKPEVLSDALVADKVIGKGAAVLMAAAGVSGYITLVMSEDALAVLDSAGIMGECGDLVPRIMNRAGTGRCPLETRLAGKNDLREMLAEIDDFCDRIPG